MTQKAQTKQEKRGCVVFRRAPTNALLFCVLRVICGKSKWRAGNASTAPTGSPTRLSRSGEEA